MAETCDITIDELCVVLAAKGIETERSTLGDFVLARGPSREQRQPTPPYSPDLNPIERVFAKLKASLRKLGARAVDDLWRAIGTALDEFSPTECRTYLVNAGYSVQAGCALVGSSIEIALLNRAGKLCKLINK